MTLQKTQLKTPSLAAISLGMLSLFSDGAVISNFDFTGTTPWAADPAGTAAKENNFAAFAANASSVDTDANSLTSTLSNIGHTGGGYASFFIRDIDGGTADASDVNDFIIFSSSTTAGVGMNLGNSDATSPTNYVSFTVAPSAGYETTFESISMFTGVNGASDQYNVEIRAWDGSTETSLGLINRTSPSGTANQPVVQDVIDFTDFTSAGTTEFRLYSYNVTGGGSNGGVRFDDIVLNGVTVFVPEPTSAVLLSCAGLGLLARRRRTQR